MDIIGIVALAAFFLWLLRGRRRRDVPAPEDDVDTEIDVEALEAAERELADDPRPRSIGDEDEDDWGPGATPPKHRP